MKLFNTNRQVASPLLGGTLLAALVLLQGCGTTSVPERADNSSLEDFASETMEVLPGSVSTYSVAPLNRTKAYENSIYSPSTPLVDRHHSTVGPAVRQTSIQRATQRATISRLPSIERSEERLSPKSLVSAAGFTSLLELFPKETPTVDIKPVPTSEGIDEFDPFVTVSVEQESNLEEHTTEDRDASLPTHSLALRVDVEDELIATFDAPQLGEILPEDANAMAVSVAPVIAPLVPRRLHIDAQRRIQAAFAMADRGMFYAAQEEFRRTLGSVAEAYDAVSGSTSHTEALARGFRALSEAKSFQVASSTVRVRNIRVIVEGHKTPALKQAVLDRVSAASAVRAYHEYAIIQFGEAVRYDPAGSMALYGLAKLQSHLASKAISEQQERRDKSMTFYRAALASHPTNALAANELGVLLAKVGDPEGAIRYLELSVASRASPVAYHNLAAVQHSRGGYLAAQHSEQMSRWLLAQQAFAPRPRVALVDAATFMQYRQANWNAVTQRR